MAFWLGSDRVQRLLRSLLVAARIVYALPRPGRALLLTSWGLAQPRWWKWFLSGAAAGLAHLSRADGVLLMGIISLMALPAPGELEQARLAGGACSDWVSAHYGPVVCQELDSICSAQAPVASARCGWFITTTCSYPAQLTPDRYLAAVGRSSPRPSLVRCGRSTDLCGCSESGLSDATIRDRTGSALAESLADASRFVRTALFLAMTVAFTWPGMNGGWLHSGAALLPFIMAAGVAGLDDTIRWIARRRAGWNVAQARQVFGAGAVAIAIFLTVWLLAASVVGLPYSGQVAWNRRDIVYREVGEALAARGVPSARR
jgi:hypothetical protein